MPYLEDTALQEPCRDSGLSDNSRRSPTVIENSQLAEKLTSSKIRDKLSPFGDGNNTLIQNVHFLASVP